VLPPLLELAPSDAARLIAALDTVNEFSTIRAVFR